ncbi:hypothetical protein F5880DRAFT_1538793 [Lentinula raphanica]|nr:hypothetical protein F5880DRAFT_1538793 [Lentinula raphanica]
MPMSINGSDSVRKLNFSLATFIDSHISWIGVSSKVECDHFTDAITTSYCRCEQPFGEFFFDVFGCLKSVYQISDRLHTKHIAYIGTASDTPFHTYQAAMFNCQAQFLNTLQHVENVTGSMEHPLFLLPVMLTGYTTAECVLLGAHTFTLFYPSLVENGEVLHLFSLDTAGLYRKCRPTMW